MVGGGDSLDVVEEILHRVGQLVLVASGISHMYMFIPKRNINMYFYLECRLKLVNWHLFRLPYKIGI